MLMIILFSVLINQTYSEKLEVLDRFRNSSKGESEKGYDTFEITALKDTELTMVIVRGHGINPTMLITNLNPNSKRLTLAVLKAYIKRWKIEEYFRFKKQKFDFENFIVMGKLINKNSCILI